MLGVLGIGLLQLFDIETSKAKWIGLSLISGIGFGPLYTATSVSIQACASAKDHPFAAALSPFMVNLGQTLGVPISGAIFQNKLRSTLLSHPSLAPQASAYSRDAAALVATIQNMTDTEDKRILVSSYVTALKEVWVVMCALAAVAMVSSMLMLKEYTLHTRIESDQRFVTRSEDQGVSTGAEGNVEAIPLESNLQRRVVAEVSS